MKTRTIDTATTVIVQRTPPSRRPAQPATMLSAVTAAFRPLPLILQALVLLDVGAVSASICKSNLCTREQYCCGDGQCCDNVYSLWYLCGGVAVMLFVVGSFCPVIRQCCCPRTTVMVKYVPVPTSPTKFKYSDRGDSGGKLQCTRVDVTLPMPPPATTTDVTNCI
ncbi:Hypothetical protein CINCED_3A001932 [Cinara cedri]|uniref:Uncharacterized protein n=1 Tax=Cinara cedri TaxID=506608 RepID=A0A5E4N9F5_9HEMI|nr:Hypothetical protein CINCED_3A001932 [Cinara cedri]